MSKIDILKMGVGFVVSSGAGAIVHNIITFTAPEKVSKVMKVCTFMGGVAISGAVSAVAVKSMDDQIDGIVDLFKKPDLDEKKDEFIFERRIDAEIALSALNDIIKLYNCVSVKDFHEIIEVESNYTDFELGWYNLDKASIRKVRNGYLLDLPKPQVMVNDL